MKDQNPLRNEKGLAMVLSISLVALLTVLGVWLILESDTTHRITKSATRHEETFNRAEGALLLGLRCLDKANPIEEFQVSQNTFIDNATMNMNYGGKIYKVLPRTITNIESGQTNAQMLYVTEPDELPANEKIIIGVSAPLDLIPSTCDSFIIRHWDNSTVPTSWYPEIFFQAYDPFPEGWELGLGTSFTKYYYRIRGSAEMNLGSKGNARSNVTAFVTKTEFNRQ